jgi:glycosyltransferase involved in cell wall biosynthesis
MLCKELETEHEIKKFSFSRLYPDFLFPGKSQFLDSFTPNPNLSVPERILDSINPLTYIKTAREIDRFRPHTVIIPYWIPFLAPAYGYIAGRLKKKSRIICLLHNALPHEQHPFEKLFARLFFRQCESFVALSETVKNELTELLPDANCLVLNHPLYNNYGERISKYDAIQALNLDHKKKTLLFFGLIRDYKGLDILIDAMSLIDNSFQLVIAGECYGDFGKYQRQIDISKAKDRIHVINRYIDDAEVSALFSAADLLVAPYRLASQSGVIPVACHFDLPVIVSNAGGLHETVEKYKIGLVRKPKPDSIAEGIQTYFVSEGEKYKENCGKMKEELSWKKFAENMFNGAQTTTKGYKKE